jgi:hypothetical protein
MQIMPAKSQFAPAKIYDDLTGYRVNNRIDSVSFFSANAFKSRYRKLF